MFLSICLTACLCGCLLVRPSVYLSVSACLFVSLCVWLLVCLSVRLSVCLSGCLSVCLPVCLLECVCGCVYCYNCYCNASETHPSRLPRLYGVHHTSEDTINPAVRGLITVSGPALRHPGMGTASHPSIRVQQAAQPFLFSIVDPAVVDGVGQSRQTQP